MNYTVSNNQYNFSEYNDSVNEWLPGIVINDTKLPAKTVGDSFTVILNDPNLRGLMCSRNSNPRYLLTGCYEASIQNLAEQYDLDQLDISIETGDYDSVLLALTTSVKQKTQLLSLIENVVMSADEMRQQMDCSYEDFVIAVIMLEEDDPSEYDSLEEYLAGMTYYNETVGYTTSPGFVKEYTDIWEDHQKVAS